MPRRYFPRDEQLSPLSVIAAGLEGWRAGREERAQKLAEAEQRGFLDEMRNMQLTEGRVALAERGVREFDEAPIREVPIADSIFRDARMGREGTAPTRSVPSDIDIFEGARPGMAGTLEQVRDMGSRAFAPAPPQPDPDEIIHPAGSFIRGVGFTEVALKRSDLVRMARERAVKAAGGLRLPDDRYIPLGGDQYLDQAATPEARRLREEAADRERQTDARRQTTQDLVNAARASGASDEQVRRIEADPGLAPQVFRDLDALAAERRATGTSERAQRQAFDQLHRLDPERYDVFVPEVDYGAEYRAVLEDERTAERQRDDDARGGLSETAAFDLLDRLYGVYEVDSSGVERLSGYSISDGELYDKLRAMVRGEDIDFDALAASGNLDPVQQELVRRMVDQTRRAPAPSAAGGRGGGARGPSDVEVRDALRELSGVPREEAERILLSEGATVEQVRRVLGSR